MASMESKNSRVKIISSTYQIIHAQVAVLESQVSFFNTVIYGKNNEQERQHLWNSICLISRQSQLIPWILHGVLNVVRYPHEREGGNLSWPNYMDELEEYVSTA